MALTGLAFLFVFLAALGMALWRHPMYGLYAYIAVFYLHPPSRWWGAFLPDLRWSLLAAAVTLIACLRLKDDKARPPWLSTTPARLLLAFALWTWIQYAWALDKTNQLELAVLFTKYLVLFYVIYRLIDTPAKATAFMLVHVAGCAYLGWLGYSARFSGRLEGVGGPGIDEANAIAMHLGTGVIAGSMIILAQRNWRRWAALAAMPFILNTIVLAGSRGAFLGLIASSVTLAYLRPQQYRKLFWSLGVLGVILFGMLAHDIFWKRMGTITVAAEQSEGMDVSAASRLEIIKAQWKMFKRFPLGSGHRGTAVLSREYLDPMYLTAPPGLPVEIYGQRSSHNTFMSALAEQGIPGAVIFFGFVFWTARTLARLRKSLRQEAFGELASITAAVGASLVVVLVAGLFTDYLKAEVQVWCVALLACVTAMLPKPVARKSWVEPVAPRVSAAAQ